MHMHLYFGLASALFLYVKEVFVLENYCGEENGRHSFMIPFFSFYIYIYIYVNLKNILCIVRFFLLLLLFNARNAYN